MYMYVQMLDLCEDGLVLLYQAAKVYLGMIVTSISHSLWVISFPEYVQS